VPALQQRRPVSAPAAWTRGVLTGNALQRRVHHAQNFSWRTRTPPLIGSTPAWQRQFDKDSSSANIHLANFTAKANWRENRFHIRIHICMTRSAGNLWCFNDASKTSETARTG
jgi:hypothetical protein